MVQFSRAEGSPRAEIHKRFLAQYGDNARSKPMVYEWIEKFTVKEVYCQTPRITVKEGFAAA